MSLALALLHRATRLRSAVALSVFLLPLTWTVSAGAQTAGDETVAPVAKPAEPVTAPAARTPENIPPAADSGAGLITSPATTPAEDAAPPGNETGPIVSPVAKSSPASPYSVGQETELSNLLGEPESLTTQQVLTVPQALQQVWSVNPQILEAQQAIQAAGYDVTGSWGGFLPSVAVTNLTGDDAVSSIQASLPLWSGGMTLAQIGASEAREVIARANLDKVRLDLGLRTLAAFHGMAQAQEQAEQCVVYINALDALRATILRRKEQGVARESEVRTAESRVQQAQVEQESVQLQLIGSRNQLRELLLISPQRVESSDPGIALKSILPIDETKAVEQNPDVLIAAARIAERTEMAKQARAQLSPEIAVQYRHYYDGRSFDDTADTPQIVVQYQVGSTFTNWQKKRAEEARAEAAKSGLETAKRNAAARLVAARQQAVSASRQVLLQQQAADSTQALVESFLRQYQAGNRSWIEVLNGQREAHESALGLISARRSLAQSQHQLILQSLAWNALTR